MARTELEIITSMGTLPDGLTENNLSEVNTWRKMAAQAIRFFEKILDAFNIQIDNKLATKQYGTLQWYIDKAYEFQYQDSLIVNDFGIPEYAVKDEEKQIIARCASLFLDDIIYLKIAKLEDDVLTALTTDERTDFENYINAIAPPTKISVVSELPDLINLDIDIYIDELNAINDIETSILTNLTNFKDEFQFNGQLSISDFYEVINNSIGVISLIINNIEWKPDFETTFTSIERVNLTAGYFEYNTLNIKLYNKDNELLKILN